MLRRLYEAVVKSSAAIHSCEGARKIYLLSGCEQVLSILSQFGGKRVRLTSLLHHVLIVAFCYLCTCSAAETQEMNAASEGTGMDGRDNEA